MNKKDNLFTFITVNGLLWCFISLGFFKINGFYGDFPGLSFTVLSLAHIFLFAWLMGLLCLPFKYVAKPALKFVCVFWGSFFSLFLLIDLFVFSQYRFHIGLAMLKLFFGPAGSEIFVFPASMWLMTGGSVLLVIAFEIGLLFLSRYISLTRKWIFVFTALWVLCFAGYNCLYAWGKFMAVPSVMAQRKALPFAFPLSADRRLARWGFVAKKDPYSIPKKGNLNYPLSPLICQNPTKQNVLIITVDAFRSDMLNPEVMPLLSNWVKRPGMTVFNNHISGGNGTETGIFSLFYSLPRSYWDDFTAINLPPVLISKALDMGYEPAIFASAKLTSPAFYRNIFAPIKNLREGSKGSSSWERDVNALEDFEEFLNKHDASAPFFGFIFFDGPHAYSYPKEETIFTPAKELNYLLLTNNTDPEPYRNQYKNSVHFQDKLIDRILNDLKTRNMLENTFIVITGDHGQEINDSHNNFWGHNGNFSDYQTKVPLIVYQTGRKTPAQADYLTSHNDVAATIIQEVYKCSNPVSDYSIGRNLFDDTARPFIILSGYTDKVIRAGDEIMVLDDFGTIRRYDNHYKPIEGPIDANIIRAGLTSFRQFYR